MIWFENFTAIELQMRATFFKNLDFGQKFLLVFSDRFTSVIFGDK